MALTLLLTPGYSWTVGELVTEDKLNLTANPTVDLYGTIGSTSIGAGAVGTAQLADGAVTAVKLAATLDLSGKTLTLPAASVTYANLDTNFIADVPAATVAADDKLIFGDVTDSTNTKYTTVVAAFAAAQSASSRRFTSAETVITATGLIINTAHGLAATPRYVEVYLKCTDAAGDDGYAQNDELNITGLINSGAPILSVGANATNVFLHLANTVAVLHKSTGAFANVSNPSRWRIIVRAEL